MKTRHYFFFICVIFIVATSCTETFPEIALNKTIVEICEDSIFVLEATAASDGSQLKNVTWSSSDETVATVTADGTVRALLAGQAIITATANSKNAACVVIVTGLDLSRFIEMPKSKKRGVSFSFTLEDDVKLLGNAINWSYNWGVSPSATIQQTFGKYNLDFCPMAWNGDFNADQIRAYKQLNPSCEYIMAFNEPNLTDQCNYTPAQAAEKWPRLKTLANELGMKLVAPAMNYGTLSGYGDPIVWLDEFFSLVPLSDVDAISIHCYMGSASAMKSYINRFTKYGKPIWMTEFCAWEKHISSVQAQMNFMCEAIHHMECHPNVARYAWFIPRGSGALDSYPYMQLLTKTLPIELSDLGRVFVGLSSMDKTIWHTSERILAQEYSNICSSDGITNSFVAGAHLRPTTDTGGQLDICDFYTGQWLEYQIKAGGNEKTMTVRYAAPFDSGCQILLDGSAVATLNMPSTGGTTWAMATCDLPMTAGNHTVRFAMTTGNTAIHWFKFD